MTPDTLDKKPRMSKSVASLSNSWRLTKNSSSSSFCKQFDAQCLSSSSLSSAKTENSFNLKSTCSMGNATWDDKIVGGLAPKRIESGRLNVSLFDLVQLKVDDPFKNHGNVTKRISCPPVSETVSKNTQVRNDRKRSSLSDLVTLKEEDETSRPYSVSVPYPWRNEKEDDISEPDEIKKYSPSTDVFSELLVTTSREKRPKQIDIRHMSSSDLVSLKENDPFMYFSIPTVRSAAIHGNDVDMLAIKNAAKSLEVPSSYVRKTCISFESSLIADMADIDFDDMDSSALPSLTNAFYNMSMGIDDEKIDFDDDDWLYLFSEIQTAN